MYTSAAAQASSAGTPNVNAPSTTPITLPASNAYADVSACSVAPTSISAAPESCAD